MATAAARKCSASSLGTLHAGIAGGAGPNRSLADSGTTVAEIYNVSKPVGQRWSTVADSQIQRLYHSVAVLTANETVSPTQSCTLPCEGGLPFHPPPLPPPAPLCSSLPFVNCNVVVLSVLSATPGDSYCLPIFGLLTIFACTYGFRCYIMCFVVGCMLWCLPPIAALLVTGFSLVGKV